MLRTESQGGASLCPGLSPCAPLGHKTIGQTPSRITHRNLGRLQCGTRALPRKTPSSLAELPDNYLIEHGVFDCLVLPRQAPPIGLFKIDLQREILSLSDCSKPSMRSDVNPTRCELSGCSNSSFQACNNIRGRSESASSVSEYSPPVSLLDPPGK